MASAKRRESSEKRREASEKERSRSLVALTWILLGLFAVSFVINVITIISIQGLKSSVQEMRDPVNLYYTQKLDVLEGNLNEFEIETRLENGKSPYANDIKKLRRDMEKTHELWSKTSRVTGTRWIMFFQRAQRSQEKAEETWNGLRTKAGY